MSLNKDYRAIVEEERKKLSNYYGHPDSVESQLKRLKQEMGISSKINSHNSMELSEDEPN